MIKEYTLESILSGSNKLNKKYERISNSTKELLKRSVDFGLKNNISINNLDMEEYEYVAMRPNNRGELVERNFVLVRPLQNELSFHIWRNEYNVDLNYTVTKHNGPDWILLKADTKEKLDLIFEIILELYNNAYH